jgi:hypothetical protein
MLIITNLASVILAFCPPLKVAPLSPTTVPSPWGRFLSRSCLRAQASTTLTYQSSLHSRPQTMFSRTVPVKAHPFCEAYPTFPKTQTVPDDFRSSPRIAWRRVVYSQTQTQFISYSPLSHLYTYNILTKSKSNTRMSFVCDPRHFQTNRTWANPSWIKAITQ